MKPLARVGGVRRVGKRWQKLIGAAVGTSVLGAVVALFAGGAAVPPPGPLVVFGYNELGMHCMNEDFSEFMILPPFNTLRAQVVQRGVEPQVLTSGLTVRYSLPGNTHSSDKTNFWAYSTALFGVSIPPDVGLTGNGLAGTMTSRTPGANDWEASGVPVTPIDDTGRENPYPMALIEVLRSGSVQAATQAVVPVSWEISCNICHANPGVSVGRDILTKHDARHGTSLVNQMPVNCSSCHADPALGAPGVPGVKNLSLAMHGSHTSRMGPANLAVNCYACHPGVRTQCQRDTHSARGMNCYSCHGQMTDVANPVRRPWQDLPRCADCHQANHPTWEFEQPGVLFKNSVGHGGVKCVSCHNSPHAVTPSTAETDNQQSLRLQGHPGKIDTCNVCHTVQPSDGFFHRRNN